MGRVSMKILILFLILINSVFAQGIYFNNESGLSAGANYGRYSSQDQIGFNAALTYKGRIDLSFSHSKLLTSYFNNQNEYFIRTYLLSKEKFFISTGIGYIFQRAETELWNGYSLIAKDKGLAMEGGLHLNSKIDESKEIVFSVFYRYYNPIEELQTPETNYKKLKNITTLIFDLGYILKFNRLGLEIGPRAFFDLNGAEPYYVLNIKFMLMY
jgi:hypothetical protein